MEIICINLKSLNELQLYCVCENNELCYDTLLNVKKSGFIKVWIENYSIIAFTSKNDPEIQLTTTNNGKVSRKKYKGLKKIKPIKTPKMKKKTNVSKDNSLLKVNITDINSKKIEQLIFLN